MPQVDKVKKEYKKVIVEGIAMYASVHKPKKPYTDGDIPAYTLDLIVSDSEAEKLLAEGLKVSKVKVDEDTKKPKEYSTHPGMKVFQFRRKTQKSDGTMKAPLQVLDSTGSNPVPPTTLIGNGSKVRVAVNPYTFNLKGKPTTAHELLGVQVLELVEYKSNNSGGTFEPVKGGFTVPRTTKNLSEEQKIDSSYNEEDPFAE